MLVGKRGKEQIRNLNTTEEQRDTRSWRTSSTTSSTTFKMKLVMSRLRFFVYFMVWRSTTRCDPKNNIEFQFERPSRKGFASDHNYAACRHPKGWQCVFSRYF